MVIRDEARFERIRRKHYERLYHCELLRLCPGCDMEVNRGEAHQPYCIWRCNN